MELILIRHGESEGNINHLVYGHTDHPLTKKGQSQIPRIIEALKSYKIDKVYSSPLRRAKAIADGISESRGLSTQTDDRLMEIHFGIYENINNKLVKEALGEGYYELIGFLDHYDIPEGEHQDDFLRRVADFVDSLLGGADGTYVITSHYGVMKAILNHLMDFDKTRLRQLAMKPGCVLKLTVKKDRVRLDELIQTIDKV